MNVKEKQEKAIKFISRDVEKWNKEFPFYFIGNIIVLAISLFLLSFAIFLFFMLGGFSENSLFAEDRGEIYLAAIMGILSFGAFVFYVAGKGFLSNIVLLSSYIERGMRLSKGDLARVY